MTVFIKIVRLFIIVFYVSQIAVIDSLPETKNSKLAVLKFSRPKSGSSKSVGSVGLKIFTLIEVLSFDVFRP